MRISDWSSDVCSSDLCIDCHKGIAHELPNMEGIEPGWRAPPEFRGETLPQTFQTHELQKHLAGIPPVQPSAATTRRSEEHTSELQSLMRISYAVFCLKKKIKTQKHNKAITITNNKTIIKYKKTN